MQAALLCLFFLAVGAIDQSTVTVWLGSGCFWGRQHDLVDLEQRIWNRTDSEVTAVGGYAGGTRSGHLCYHNDKNTSVYSDVGAAEVVQIDAPETQLEALFETYFSSFVQIDAKVWAREDEFDLGSAFRAAIGAANFSRFIIHGSLDCSWLFGFLFEMTLFFSARSHLF